MKKLVSLLLVLSLASAFLLTGCASKCEHSYTHLDSSTATCSAAGTETYVCDDCGEVAQTKEVGAYDHVYSTKTDTNYKCKYCDLVKYNVTVSHVPETINVYNTTRDTLVGTFAVGDVSWSFDGDDLKVSVKVERTYTNSSYRLALLYIALTDSEGKTFERYVEDTTGSETVVFYFSDDYLEADEVKGQLFYDLVIYDNVHFSGSSGPYEIEGTLNSAQ